jgi:putative copper export protein
MYALYITCVVVHILTATLWVGGMGFFALVVVPVVRRNVAEADAQRVLRAAGKRFATVGWYALGTLFVTGVGNLAFRGLLPALVTTEFWRSSFGTTLALKVVAFACVLGASAAHSRDALRPREPARPRGRSSSASGRTTLLLSMGVVALGVMLVRGAPW